MANAAAASRDKMPRRQSADGSVVDPDEGRFQPGDGTVNQDIGYVPLLNSPEQIQTMDWLGGSDDEPIHLPSH